MKKPYVSFIVPIYNVEKYIETGVKSIINQNYDNIEIILVDDGSTDSSGSIIDKLKTEDDRIIVIHKKNGGVSSARNIGLEKARGEYVVFVDGDDFIDQDYTDYFLNMIKKKDYDIAMGLKNYDLKNKEQNEYNTGIEYLSNKIIEDIYIGKMGVAVWNKMYKKSFLDDNKIRFNEDIWYGEGMLFNIQCLTNTNKVIVGNKLVYHQIFNPNSAMRKFNIESNYCGIKSLDIQKKYLPKNETIINAWKYHKRCFNMSILIGIIKSDTIKKYNKDYKECIKNLKKNIFIPMKVNIPIKKKFYYFVSALNPVLAAKISIKRERELLNNYK